MTKEPAITKLLNNLLETNCDAKRGYQKAAEEMDSPALKGWLMSLAEQRENFKKSIREEIKCLGGEPAIFQHVQGKIQQSFVNPDLLYLLNHIERTLRECLRYEASVLADYEQRLPAATVPASTRNLIIGQQENIKLALEDLKSMTRDPSYMA